MKNLHKSYLVAGILFLLPYTSNAEGTLPGGTGIELYGANRRAETQVSTLSQPYCGVEGIFDVPTVFIPDGRYSPSIGFVGPDAIYGRANSKPTFYLGARQERNSFAVDAGVQYEWKAVVTRRTDPTSGAVTMKTVPPGYTVFIDVANGIENGDVFVNAANGYRFGQGTDNPLATSVQLRWIFDNGTIGLGNRGHLDVFVAGAAEQPRDSNNPANPPGRIDASGGARLVTNLEGTRVRRVVGITQGGQGFVNNLNFPLDSDNTFYEEDGSFMRGLKFQNGRVATRAVSPIWEDWDDLARRGGMDDGTTGSAPGPFTSDQTVTTGPARGQHLSSSLPLFRYSTIDLLTNLETVIFPVSTTPERYKYENIDINLRAAVAVNGEVVSPGGGFLNIP